MHHFDLIVIGSGAAASAATTKAHDLGKTVAVIEKGTVGGTCVNVGCVPSKFFLVAGELIHASREPGFPGLSPNGGLGLDFPRLVQEKNELVASLRETKYEQALENLENVTLIRGEARFVSPSEVQVGNDRLSADYFLIAAGSSPAVPPIPGLPGAGYLTNVEALDLRSVPRSLAVIGAGPLGLEFAQMYRRFGAEVTVLQRSPILLPRFEPEVGEALHQYLSDEGIRFVLGSKVAGVERTGDHRALTVEVTQAEETPTERLEVKEILVASGRRANTGNLGLEEAGVTTKNDGAIQVDETFKTSQDHVYAAGDILGEPMLETLAAREGSLAAENMFKDAGRTINFQAVPQVIFTDPQVATVGLTDEEANGRGFACACRTLPMSAVPKAAILRDTRGLVKMVAEAETGRILGVSIVARGAGDLIHEATLAIKHGLTVDDIIDTIHVFPTLSESLKLVAVSYYRRDIANMPCCTE